MKSRTRKVDKAGDSVSFFLGVVGLVVILGAGIFIPLKMAEVMFGYSLSDAFWEASKTAEYNQDGGSQDSSNEVQRSRR